MNSIPTRSSIILAGIFCLAISITSTCVAVCYMGLDIICKKAGDCNGTCGTTSCYDSNLQIWVSWPVGTTLLQDVLVPGVKELYPDSSNCPHYDKTTGKDSYLFYPVYKNAQAMTSTVDVQTCVWSTIPTTAVVSCEKQELSGNDCIGCKEDYSETGGGIIIFPR